MTTHVKICGLVDAAGVNAAAAAGAQFAGFVYYLKSPRHISLEGAKELKKLLPEHVESVSVLVDPEDVFLSQVQSIFAPDFVQLHGSESPVRLSEIKQKFPEIKIIKAVKVASSEDIENAKEFYDVADMLLFDAAPPKDATLPGGNGVSFDWKILRGFSCPLPWFLSGGLTPENVRESIAQSGAKMVDVSSGVEISAGKKSPELIDAFIAATR
ncbi:MAG: phosphoribosylanthranilate isomerase [Alphaproteobacteria bacterium]|nr:phosphoribosylanthranilate isomerase [Alphaproteobacteria bacterium]